MDFSFCLVHNNLNNLQEKRNNMTDLLVLMKKYNFTEYETKVYATLLEIGPSTGYEISKMSSVPRSKVYNTLEILLKKGAVYKANKEQILYTAVEVEDFINHLKQDTRKDLDVLKDTLLQHSKTTFDRNEIWSMDGYDNIIAKTKACIRNAKKELLIQIWDEDLDEELLEILKEKEVEIEKYILILFSEDSSYDVGLNRFYKHHFEKEKRKEMGSRWINIVADNDFMLLSTIYSNKMANAVMTHFYPMVFLSKEYIAHDGYTANILEHLDDATKAKFGDHMQVVRNIYK